MVYKKTFLRLALVLCAATVSGAVWYSQAAVAIAQGAEPVLSTSTSAIETSAGDQLNAALEAVLQPGVTPGGTTVRIDGTPSMVTINQLLKQDYERQFPGTAVTLEVSNTDAALQELQAGEIDLAAIARPLTAAEKAQGLKQIPISLDKIAVIVGRDNPFKGVLTVDQFAKIFRGEITDWAEVGATSGPIRLIDRPANSDTRLALSQYGIFEPGSFVTGANAVQVETDNTAEVIKLLGRDGIGYAIASQLSNQTKARLVKIGVIQETLPDDTIYPYAQTRGYAYKDENPAVAAFLNYASDTPGQAAVAAGKLAEAKAIALGGVKATATSTSDPADRGWLGWLWLFLPLIGLGLVLQVLVNWLRSLYPSAARRTPDAAPTDSLTADIDLAESRAQILPAAPLPSLPGATEASSSSSDVVPNTTAEISLETAPESTEVDSSDVDTSVHKPSIEPFIASEPTELSTPDALPTTAPLAADNPLYQQALTLVAAEQFSEALPLLDQVVAMLPNFAEAWATRGEALVGLSRTEDAQISFNCARDLDPTFVRPGYTPVPIAEPSLSSEQPPVDDVPVDALEIAAVAAEVEAALGIIAGSPTEPETAIAADSDTAREAGDAVELAVEADAIAPTAPTLDFTPGVVTSHLSEAGEGGSAAALRQIIVEYLARYQDKTPETATPQDLYLALAYGIRDRLLQLNTPNLYLTQSGSRIVGEFSAEYLPGPHLANNLLNLDLTAATQQALNELGIELETLVALEEEPGLGRGGLGRLMVCYLDSLATATVPAIGYGIRYEYGIFDQDLSDGWQVEVADEWLRNGNPWEVERPEFAVDILFGGHSEAYLDAQSQFRMRWIPTETIRAMPYDTPIPGYQTETVNLLRLWKAESAENLSQVLYPNDTEAYGKQVRLKQQFFFVSASLQDILRQHLATGASLENLSDRFALQLNDTDPVIAIPELMRLLMDDHGLGWDNAWEITQQTFAYTNHSLLPEALDQHHYTLSLLHQYLPRHYEIILGINCRFLNQVRDRYPNDEVLVERLSLIDETGEQYVRMVNLACVGTHAVNGVSLQHTQLLKQALPELLAYFPNKFGNITNGITPRRFLVITNSRLATLISHKVGASWLTQLTELTGLEAYVDDAEFRAQWQQVKQAAKQELAAYIQAQAGVEVDPTSLFDVYATEIHEYKRQTLSALHVITLYNRIKADPQIDMTPRTVIISGKAAPDYFLAKLSLKLITAIADTVNNDPDVRGRLKLVFLKDLTVKSSQLILPAADLIEQIAPAGTDACATSNMIAALNGALLIGTPDGSNLELRDALGADQVFMFGLTAEAIAERRQQGYHPDDAYNGSGELQQAIASISNGTFSNQDGGLFQPLVERWLTADPYYLLADYADYIACQQRVAQAYQQSDRWTRMSILTTARMGQFASDRAIQEYCHHIWNIVPGQVQRRTRQEIEGSSR